MAKKEKVNKSDAVREYVTAHPEARNIDIYNALAKKGIEVAKPQISALVKGMNGGKSTRKTADKATSKAKPGRKAAVKSTGTPDRDTLKAVKEFAAKVGGYDVLTDSVEFLKELSA